MKMSKPFMLRVLKKDIRQDNRRHALNCPVTLALNRKIKAPYLRVDGDLIEFGEFRSPSNNDDLFTVMTPQWLAKWISAFDDGNFEIAKPFKRLVRIRGNQLIACKK